jgi:hypothetical protein
MWTASIRNVVVIFQTTILRFFGFYVRRSANVFVSKEIFPENSVLMSGYLIFKSGL